MGGKGMDDLGLICIVAGLLGGFVVLMTGIGTYEEITIATLKYDAWVGVAREVGQAISSLGGG